MEGEDPIHSLGRKEISAADISFQLVFYKRRIYIFRGILKVEPGLIWSLEEVLKQVHEHIGPKTDIHVDVAVHVAQPSVFAWLSDPFNLS
jgi:hypothetical protein